MPLSRGSRATLLGTRTQTSPDLAAFVNGLMVRYLDYNDNYAGLSNAHPSDNIAPMMALAEASDASGEDLIVGIVLAYEYRVPGRIHFDFRMEARGIRQLIQLSQCH